MNLDDILALDEQPKQVPEQKERQLTNNSTYFMAQ